jgi:hypothetical protein
MLVANILFNIFTVTGRGRDSMAQLIAKALSECMARATLELELEWLEARSAPIHTTRS